jgi:hypothetical protein
MNTNPRIKPGERLVVKVIRTIIDHNDFKIAEALSADTFQCFVNEVLLIVYWNDDRGSWIRHGVKGYRANCSCIKRSVSVSSAA